MIVQNTPIRFDGIYEIGVAKCRISHTDLTDADTSQTFTFNTLAKEDGSRRFPANARPMYAWINVITGFSGGSVSAITAALGDAGDIDELITAVSVLDGAEGLKVKSGTYTLGSFETAYAPIVTIVSTDDDLENVDAGVIEVCIAYESIQTRAATR